MKKKEAPAPKIRSKADLEKIRTRVRARLELEATGCVGICQFEPVVEVYQPGGSRTTYVRMTPERGVRVIRQHIQGGNPLAEFTIGSAQNRG